MALISINSNLASLQAQRRLGQTTSGVRQVFERLSSGQRINRASDDAAGLSISDTMRADRRVLNQGLRNFNDGISMLSIGESSLTEMTNIVTRIKELAEQAANGTLGNTQRKALDAEAQSLAKEYLRIAQTTTFNGQKMFDGSVQNPTLQGGYGTSGGLQLSMGGAIGTGYFNPVSNLPGLQPSDIRIGDMNGDGNNDLIVAAYGNLSIAVYTGNGNGTFKAPQLFGTAKGFNFTVNDFNGDGFLDTAMATWPTQGVGVNLGGGNGTIGSTIAYYADPDVDNITSGDLNGDGFVDIVTTNNGDNSIAVLLGNGNGTFKAANSYVTDASSREASIGDVNGDGISDIATFNNGGNTVSVLIGNGNGSFKSKVDYSTPGTGTTDGRLVDINDDGILDLVGIESGTSAVSVLIGNGNGSFKAASSFAFGQTLTSINTADFNGDGFQDITTTSNGGEFSVMLNNGNGTFKALISATIDADTFNVAVGDLNGDGVADIATANYGSGSVSVLIARTVDGVSSLPNFSLKTRADALQAMGQMSIALKNRALQRGVIGAYQSRLEAASNVLAVSSENLAAAESRIRDTDVAEDAATLVRLRILQQATAGILGQANLQPQLALTLIGGV